MKEYLDHPFWVECKLENSMKDRTFHFQIENDEEYSLLLSFLIEYKVMMPVGHTAFLCIYTFTINNDKYSPGDFIIVNDNKLKRTQLVWQTSPKNEH